MQVARVKGQMTQDSSRRNDFELSDTFERVVTTLETELVRVRSSQGRCKEGCRP